MSNEQMIQMILGVTFKYMSKEANRPSSFAGIILAEEFFEYIMSLYKGQEELMVTHDELAACDAEDGEEVEFVDGIVPGRAIFSRERNAIPDGKYTIRKNGKHAWVEANVRDRIEARINESYAENELILQTEPIDTEEKADDILRQLNGANDIALISKAGITKETTEYSILVADGHPLVSYQTRLQKMEKDSEGNLVAAKRNGKVDYEIAHNLRKFYASKTGIVAFAHRISFGEASKKKYAIVVALKEVKKMEISNVQEIQKAIVESGWIEQRKETKKAAAGESFKSRRNNLRVEGAKIQASADQSKTGADASNAFMLQLLAKARQRAAEEEAKKKAPVQVLAQPAQEKGFSRLSDLRTAGATIQ